MRRSRTSSAIALALALAGCPDDGNQLTEVEGRVEVSPRQRDLEVPVGVVARAEFTVRNSGRISLTVQQIRIEGDGIFAFEGDLGGALGPGEERGYAIVAQPEAETLYSADITFQTSVGDATVQVTLLGEPTPDCDDGNDCTVNRFDPELNSCVTAFDDGASCEPADKCIVDAICSQGLCLGRSKTCSDDSVCTTDLCRQADGECIFIEDENTCDDGNPCTADGCGLDGCIHENLLAGTPCDDGDECTVNDACFSGQCLGASQPDGAPCDDGDSCTENTICSGGVCSGPSIIEAAEEGDVVFTFTRPRFEDSRAFLHRREVSMADDGLLVALDHISTPTGGFIHDLFAVEQCGTERYAFRYEPDSATAFVRFVRRALQIRPSGEAELIVGVRQLPEFGDRPETTTFRVGPNGAVLDTSLRALGGETGWSLTPDGSFTLGVILPGGDDGDPSTPDDIFTMERRSRDGDVLWRNSRAVSNWAEFLGVAGPRVLFWSENRFGALDFATGALVWSRPTAFVSKEMALSTALNLGVARVGTDETASSLVAVELLDGDEVFRFPPQAQPSYQPRTDPVISSDGRIMLMMERRTDGISSSLEWVELSATGEVLSATPLPYTFPPNFSSTRHEDPNDDPYPTVADDGITYVGYGDRFWAIDPGGGIRWTLTSTINGFTGSVPLLRDDGILIINADSRTLLGVKTNGGRMDARAWSSFRNDRRRSNYTP